MNELAKFALTVAKEVQKEGNKLGRSSENIDEVSSIASISRRHATQRRIDHKDIYDSLCKVSDVLGNSYLQIKEDVQDTSRLSWAGTAHEIRQLLSTLLETLASDESVTTQPWYKQDPNTKGPTRKQRVRYILQMHKVGSKEQAVAEQVAVLDEMIGTLVTEIYSRGSDAAHRFKAVGEVKRILSYFEAFAQDLLNLG